MDTLASLSPAAGPSAGTTAGARGQRLAPVEPLAVTGCGVLTSAGLGLRSLRELLRRGAAENRLPEGDTPGDFPAWPLRAVPALDVATLVGRKGVRNLDRMTIFGLITCGLALEQAAAADEDDDDDDERRSSGVVLGTSTGSVRSIAELARDSLTQERPYLVNASRFPNTVMNSTAGQIAIRYALPGVNATIAAGQISSLSAIRYARVAIAGGRARRLLVGGIEELSPLVAWSWMHSAAVTAGTALGEGCAIFVVEPVPPAGARGREILAELLGCEVAYCGGNSSAPLASVTTGLSQCVQRALARSGVTPDEVDIVALGAGGHTWTARAERKALFRALGRTPRTLDITQTLGECYSASAALQLAALIATRDTAPADPHTDADGGAGLAGTRDQVGLVTAVGRDGNVGCLVVRL